MKNRNTKDVGENHIYLFIFSNLALFIGIFLSLNSANDAALPLFSISINLFSSWAIFYLGKKKKLSKFSEHYNNLLISILSIAALIPIILLLISLLAFPDFPNSYLLFFSWVCSLIAYNLILKSYSWETKVEKILIIYRMSIEQEKEDAFLEVEKLIDESNPKKFEEYIEKSQLFDKKMENYLNTKLS